MVKEDSFTPSAFSCPSVIISSSHKHTPTTQETPTDTSSSGVFNIPRGPGRDPGGCASCHGEGGTQAAPPGGHGGATAAGGDRQQRSNGAVWCGGRLRRVRRLRGRLRPRWNGGCQHGWRGRKQRSECCCGWTDIKEQ